MFGERQLFKCQGQHGLDPGEDWEVARLFSHSELGSPAMAYLCLCIFVALAPSYTEICIE